MRSETVQQLVTVRIEMSAQEAGDLYAELYRLSSDILEAPYPFDSAIGNLMRELVNAGAPGT